MSVRSPGDEISARADRLADEIARVEDGVDEVGVDRARTVDAELRWVVRVAKEMVAEAVRVGWREDDPGLCRVYVGDLERDEDAVRTVRELALRLAAAVDHHPPTGLVEASRALLDAAETAWAAAREQVDAAVTRDITEHGFCRRLERLGDGVSDGTRRG